MQKRNNFKFVNEDDVFKEIYENKDKKEIVFDDFDNDFNNCYIKELKTFLSACQRDKIEYPDLDVGIDTMKLIINAEKSHTSKKLEVTALQDI